MWLNIAPVEAFESVLNTLIPAALEEDLDGGDVTTKAIVPRKQPQTPELWPGHRA